MSHKLLNFVNNCHHGCESVIVPFVKRVGSLCLNWEQGLQNYGFELRKCSQFVVNGYLRVNEV